VIRAVTASVFGYPVLAPTISGVSELANLTELTVMILKSRGIPSVRRGSVMKAYWVIDILKDIRQFSEKNGMVELAEQLDVRGVSQATADNEIN
jgi:hypothetical protein